VPSRSDEIHGGPAGDRNGRKPWVGGRSLLAGWETELAGRSTSVGPCSGTPRFRPTPFALGPNRSTSSPAASEWRSRAQRAWPQNVRDTAINEWHLMCRSPTSASVVLHRTSTPPTGAPRGSSPRSSSERCGNPLKTGQREDPDPLNRPAILVRARSAVPWVHAGAIPAGSAA
jgi:hypothetical protein